MDTETDGRDMEFQRGHLNRRDFLKSVGLGIGAAMTDSTLFAQTPDSPEKTERVLSEADQRIDRHRKADATLTLACPSGVSLEPGQEVAIEQQRHKFLFGSNLFKLGRCRTDRDNTAYASQFAKLLNYATLPFYWWSYERHQGQPDEARTEEAVRWCKANDITPKGHPLAWNWVDPAWLPDDPKQAMALQLARIEQCAERFRGSIDIWDVVNEATHFDRPECLRQAPRLTAAIQEMGIGTYVRQAFQKARQGNPVGTLIINDYRTDPAYSDKVLSVLIDDRDRPLYDVIGIQSHMHGGSWGAAKAWEVCERFARFGRPLHFTETTLVSGPKTEQAWKTTPEGEGRQAAQVCEFYTVLFSHPAVQGITWWDFSDQDAWQSAPAGLVRDDMTAKPAYEQLLDLVTHRWWTHARAVLDDQRRVQFRGFLGKYRLTLKAGSRELNGSFVLDGPGSQTLRVTLA